MQRGPLLLEKSLSSSAFFPRIPDISNFFGYTFPEMHDFRDLRRVSQRGAFQPAKKVTFEIPNRAFEKSNARSLQRSSSVSVKFYALAYRRRNVCPDMTHRS